MRVAVGRAFFVRSGKSHHARASCGADRHPRTCVRATDKTRPPKPLLMLYHGRARGRWGDDWRGPYAHTPLSPGQQLTGTPLPKRKLKMCSLALRPRAPHALSCCPCTGVSRHARAVRRGHGGKGTFRRGHTHHFPSRYSLLHDSCVRVVIFGVYECLERKFEKKGEHKSLQPTDQEGARHPK